MIKKSEFYIIASNSLGIFNNRYIYRGCFDDPWSYNDTNIFDKRIKRYETLLEAKEDVLNILELMKIKESFIAYFSSLNVVLITLFEEVDALGNASLCDYNEEVVYRKTVYEYI